MTRRSLALAAAAALLSVLRPRALAAAEGDLSASWLSPSLELGEVVPAAPEAPGTPASVMVVSRGAYQIAIVRGARDAGPARTGDADDLRVRTSSGGFAPLPPGVPVTVASGSATQGAGAVVSVELRASATYDAAPGARRERLRLLLNGQPVDAELLLRWTVAPAFAVSSDPRPYDLRTVEPGAPGRYALEPRAYVVTTNAPWRLEALVRDVPKQRGTLEALAPESLEVQTEFEGRKVLRPGAPVVVARGAATGRAGRSVSLRLLLSSGGDETAGLYHGEIDVRVLPADAPAIVEAVR